MKFRRSKGFTPSEMLLADLCDQSFLSLWSYPNLFNDRGKVRSGSGKELCDLLVVFGDHILIFSDKSCNYPNTGDPITDWRRWYRRSVQASADQIYGAERWIRDFPDHIFLDHACTQQLPITLPSRSSMNIHRICIALGASERAQAQKGVGSLAISPVILKRDDFSLNRLGIPKSGR